MHGLILFVLCTIIFGENRALKLPDYMKQCSKTDPNLKECILKHGNEAIPHLLKGDRTYQIPPLVPLRVPEIVINNGNLKVVLNELDVIGLENVQLQETSIDFERQHIKVVCSSAYNSIRSNYTISGQILIMPLTGQGDALFEFLNGTYDYQVNYTYYNKNGEKYGKIIDQEMAYTVDRVTYRLDNLFGVNKLLGENTNKVLNENWDAVNHEIGDEIAKAIAMVITSIVNGFLSKIPSETIFLP